MYEKFGLLIDNEWRPALSGRTMPVHSPATEEEIGTVPSADAEDVALVLASAERGLATWKAMAAWDRARIMRRTAEILRERNEEIARVMSTECGKPLAEAKGEMNGTADLFEWYAEEAKRVYGQLIPSRAPDQRLSVVYQPIGVCPGVVDARDDEDLEPDLAGILPGEVEQPLEHPAGGDAGRGAVDP